MMPIIHLPTNIPLSSAMNQLVDRFGRAHTYLRISVTDRCNLRCAYCIPQEIVSWRRREELLSFEEIVRVARVAVGMGIEKIRITGGEPFVRNGLPGLLAKLRAIDGLETIAITTNAVLLARHIDEIRPNVDALNISLDTFHRDRFLTLTRRDALNNVIQGIERALDAGYHPKINAVVIRGVNDDELVDFVRFAAERPVSVRFIEFMPFAGNNWAADACVPMPEMIERIEQEFVLERLEDPVSPISRDYAITDRIGGRRGIGTIGFIASMSHPFCSSCSRLRLTAEGRVMPCLHSPIEFDVRTPIRSGGDDNAIADIFLQAVGAKPKEHPSAEEMIDQAVRGMVQIGG